ncbi:hypothetical protein BH20ACT24_BH20ACT24_15580 [soil metagenome]
MATRELSIDEIMEILRILREDHPAWKGMNPRAWIKHADYPEWEFGPTFRGVPRPARRGARGPRAAAAGHVKHIGRILKGVA